MKQIINKEDKAVSPIIATILLIAITVVLAATLYTVLGGFTSGLSTSGSATMNGTFANSTSNTSSYSYTFSISSVSNGGISLTSLELKFTNATGSYTVKSLISGSQTVNSLKSTSNYTINITGLSGGKVVAGTTITIWTYMPKNGKINNLGLEAISQISIIDTASNSVIYTS